MNQEHGASGKPDRAAGLRPQPPAASSQSSIPSAAIAQDELHGCIIRRPGDTCEVRKEFLAVALEAMSALAEAVYAVRNVAGISEWARRHKQPWHSAADEDFTVWAENWSQLPAVASMAAADDARAQAA